MYLLLAYEPEQGRNDSFIGEEWKIQKCAMGGMHLKRLGTTVLGYKRGGLYCTQAKTSCSWVNLIHIFHEAW